MTVLSRCPAAVGVSANVCLSMLDTSKPSFRLRPVPVSSAPILAVPGQSEPFRKRPFAPIGSFAALRRSRAARIRLRAAGYPRI